jgi:hypothetical protein
MDDVTLTLEGRLPKYDPECRKTFDLKWEHVRQLTFRASFPSEALRLPRTTEAKWESSQ